jgi:hypothetical protein
MQTIRAGHDLDATIAERVMGAVRVRDVNEGRRWHWLDGTMPGWRYPNGRVYAADEGLPPYSTDTCATWEVVMSLIASGWRVRIDPCGDDSEPGAWRARMSHQASGVIITEIGRTASLAICLVALRAMAARIDFGGAAQEGASRAS